MDHLNASTVVVPTQMAYTHIPTNELRDFADGMFPGLAKNATADVAKGYSHRYVAGHDLLLDVPRTFVTDGAVGGARHAGHILLTDFVTKAGIPIPGFSQSGLGLWLEQAGIHRGWLQVNLCDTGLGIFAVAEGSSDLLSAIHGSLLMSGSTFFDTVAEGGIEIGLALMTKNPILLAGGIENIAAGIASAWNSVSIYVDPLIFFGSAGTSALIGIGLSYGLAGQSLSEATITGIRSGAIGGLFALSAGFGFGALAGFVAYGLGSKLAKAHNASIQGILTIDDSAYRLLLEELFNGNSDLNEFLNRAEQSILLIDEVVMLPTQGTSLNYDAKSLPNNCLILNCEANAFSDNGCISDSEVSMTNNSNRPKALREDSAVLISYYEAL